MTRIILWLNAAACVANLVAFFFGSHSMVNLVVAVISGIIAARALREMLA
jgi:hypothetical protein